MRRLHLPATLALLMLSVRVLFLTGCASSTASGMQAPNDMGAADLPGSPVTLPGLSLSAPVLLDVPDGQRGLAAVDLNQDHYPEIIATLPYQGKLSMLWNHGTATFEPHQVSVPGAPYGLAIADLNADSLPDVAYTDNTGGSLTVLLLQNMIADRDHPFLPAMTYALKPGAAVLRAGYLHQQMDLDLAVLNIVSGDISVFVNQGSAMGYTFVEHPNQLLAGTSHFSLAILPGQMGLAGDLVVTSAASDSLNLLRNLNNGDMRLDAGPSGTVSTPRGPVFVTTDPPVGGTNPRVYVASSSSNQVQSFTSSAGTLLPLPAVALSDMGHPVAIAIGDLDQDGHPDLVIAHNANDTVEILLGVAAGTYTSTSLDYFSVIPAPVAVAIADLNGD